MSSFSIHEDIFKDDKITGACEFVNERGGHLKHIKFGHILTRIAAK